MLEIAKIVELAKEHATPMYLFDLDELQSRVQAMKEILGEDIRLCYAMKSQSVSGRQHEAGSSQV